MVGKVIAVGATGGEPATTSRTGRDVVEIITNTRRAPKIKYKPTDHLSSVLRVVPAAAGGAYLA